jgi:glycosyltransferase involved in cell wall biosynthesis
MRIALVSEHASPLAALGGVDAGGQNVHVAALAARLTAHGHEVTVFTRRDAADAPDRVATPDGYAVEHVVAGPPTDMPKDDMWRHMPQFADGLGARLGAGGYDLVHSHFWMSGWATLRAVARTPALAQLPVVHTYHALGVVKRRHQGAADTSPPDRLDVERSIGASVDRVIATARDEVRELEREGIDAARCAVVPCGVDTELFTPTDDPVPGRSSGPWSPGARHRLLALGRVVERKGIADVVTALQWLPGAELVVAGGGPPDVVHLDPEVRRLSTHAEDLALGDRLRFTGSVPHDQVPALIAACDIVVSVPWYEPFGIVPLEAMACGRPLVGSAVGGLLDSVVPGETGELVPPRDPDALAQALRDLLADPDRRRAYGERGTQRVRELFTWDRVARLTEDVYADVVGEVEADGARRRMEVLR